MILPAYYEDRIEPEPNRRCRECGRSFMRSYMRKRRAL